MAEELTSSPVFVNRPNLLSAMYEALSREPAIAVDTESNSLYAYREQVCLIQFSIPGADYLVDPLARLDLQPLGNIFADPSIQKVFHAAEQDVAGLRRDMGYTFANIFDTMWAARILGWPKLGLADLLWDYFGVHTDKRYQRYNWGERPLREAMLNYARLDTHYLLPLRDLQLKELEERNRLEEAVEVFGQLAQTASSTVPAAEETFWRVKGVYDLRGKARAALWELHLWRDRTARSRNLPPFKVLGDKTLAAIALARPHTMTQLSELPGVTSYILRRYGPAVLQAVARGEQGPVPRPPQHRRPSADVLDRYQTLRTWRAQAAEVRGVGTDVVLSNAVLWALARANPATMEEMAQIDELGEWKRVTYGEEILKVLQGTGSDQ